VGTGRGAAMRVTDQDLEAMLDGDPADGAPVGGAPQIPSSWGAVDLRPVIAGERRAAPPTILRRTDGEALIYPRRLHSIASEPEGGKGWLTLAAMAEVVLAGGTAALIDFEVDAGEFVDRMEALGVPAEILIARCRYLRPDESLGDNGWRALEATLMSAPLDLVVLDGVTEAMSLDGLSPLDNVEVAGWLELPRRLIARTGAAAVLVDHLTKDRESRGKFAFGAQHKLAGVDVSYHLKVVEPFGRGLSGEVEIAVQKDRPGHVRRFADEKGRVAIVALISGDDDSVEVRVEPPGAQAEFRPTLLMERISEAIEIGDGLGKRAIRERVKGKTETKDLALALLIRDGYVTVEYGGPGKADRHHNAGLYTAAADPLADDREDGVDA
jgi:hypothetical protein